MTEESGSSGIEETKPKITIDATSAAQSEKIGNEQAVEFLKEMQENAGQISEIVMEEENLVNEFFGFLLTILKPFTKTLVISVSSLPESFSAQVSKAYLHFTGQLVLVYRSGEAEVLDLTDPKNHDVLVDITGEIILRIKIVVNSYKSKIEKRAKFLMLITKELQKVAKVFSDK